MCAYAKVTCESIVTLFIEMNKQKKKRRSQGLLAYYSKISWKFEGAFFNQPVKYENLKAYIIQIVLATFKMPVASYLTKSHIIM